MKHIQNAVCALVVYPATWTAYIALTLVFSVFCVKSLWEFATCKKALPVVKQ